MLSEIRINAISGCILEQPGVLVHQTNCSSTHSAGLAAAVFNRFPKTNTYGDWHRKRSYGKCDMFDVSEYGTAVTHVVNMNAQWFPGKVRTGENYAERHMRFSECLLELQGLVHAHRWKRINFPYRIGCGLAGGNWDVYLGLMDKFAHSVEADVYIVIPEAARHN